MTQMTMIGGTGASITATGQLPDPAAAAKAKDHAALAKAAQGFEAIFMRQLLGSMRSASLGESIDGSSAVDQFQELSDARMAENLSSSGGLGIAKLVLQQLDKRE